MHDTESPGLTKSLYLSGFLPNSVPCFTIYPMRYFTLPICCAQFRRPFAHVVKVQIYVSRRPVYITMMSIVVVLIVPRCECITDTSVILVIWLARLYRLYHYGHGCDNTDSWATITTQKKKRVYNPRTNMYRWPGPLGQGGLSRKTQVNLAIAQASHSAVRSPFLINSKPLILAEFSNCLTNPLTSILPLSQPGMSWKIDSGLSSQEHTARTCGPGPARWLVCINEIYYCLLQKLLFIYKL